MAAVDLVLATTHIGAADAAHLDLEGAVATLDPETFWQRHYVPVCGCAATAATTVVSVHVAATTVVVVAIVVVVVRCVALLLSDLVAMVMNAITVAHATMVVVDEQIGVTTTRGDL